MESSAQENILIIGAGIVGVSTALWLQRDGHHVTLIDKEGPAAGASFGNAGVLTSSSVVPITVPGLWRKAPKMLFSSDQPLFIRWRYLPKLLPFLWKYMKQATDTAVQPVSDGLTQLLHDAPDQHLALAKGTEAQKYVSTDDYIYAYADKAAFDVDAYGWNIRDQHNVKYQKLDANALAAYDPVLKGIFGYGIKCQNHGRITDPGAYVTALADHFKAKGGTILAKEVQDFDIEDGRCKGISTTSGTLKADKYILTTGAWSSAWEKVLGINVPMESERGYHIEFTNPSITLQSPVMVTSGKFVINSMNGRMRCAGVVEFGGLENPASSAPINLLKKQMATLFPQMTYDHVDEWMGHRPATADSLPIIGVSPKASNVFLGYGHQHVGLSAGPKTGRWLAKLATGAPINSDLSAYAANRKI